MGKTSAAAIPPFPALARRRGITAWGSWESRLKNTTLLVVVVVVVEGVAVQQVVLQIALVVVVVVVVLKVVQTSNS